MLRRPVESTAENGNKKRWINIMSLNGIFKFIQAATISMTLIGCSSFTCDELSDEDSLIPKAELSTSQ